jgi:hypothetical protein
MYTLMLCTQKSIITGPLFLLLSMLAVGCGETPTPALPVSTSIVPVEPVVQVANRPIAVSDDGYVTSASCKDCHEREYETWHDSYHRTMTQVVTPQTIQTMGVKMDGIGMSLADERYVLTRRGDQYWAGISNQDGQHDRQIVMSTGSHHMQAYWISTGKLRELHTLPFTWLKEDKRWVPRSSVFVMPPKFVKMSKVGMWNIACLNCHATHPQSRLFDGNKFDTRVAEFGIACEACHGPGEQHGKDELAASIVLPSNLDHRLSSQVCGHCHGISGPVNSQAERRRSQVGSVFRPGQDMEQVKHVVRGGKYADHPRTKELIELQWVNIEGSFWSDGMVRVSGREYNGMIETPCFQRGKLSCLSCHQMHQSSVDPRPRAQWANDQLQYKMQGDQVCLQCHEDMSKDIKAHTHHPLGSSGSQCMNCHMPYTTYGLLKAIRSHTITNPSVRESLDVGRPNACNQCHLDKTLKWTDDYMQRWYSHAPNELTDDQKTVSATVLWMLTGDAGLRVLAAWTAGWPEATKVSGDAWLAPYLGQLLSDPYDAVRYIAERSLRRQEKYTLLNYDFQAAPQQHIATGQKLMEEANDDIKALIKRLSKQRDNTDVWLLE